MDIYLGNKQNTEFDLGEEVVLQLTKDLHGSFCTVYFDNFFNSSILIEKLTFMLPELFAKTENNTKNAWR